MNELTSVGMPKRLRSTWLRGERTVNACSTLYLYQKVVPEGMVRSERETALGALSEAVECSGIPPENAAAAALLFMRRLTAAIGMLDQMDITKPSGLSGRDCASSSVPFSLLFRLEAMPCRSFGSMWCFDVPEPTATTAGSSVGGYSGLTMSLLVSPESGRRIPSCLTEGRLSFRHHVDVDGVSGYKWPHSMVTALMCRILNPNHTHHSSLLFASCIPGPQNVFASCVYGP